MFKNIYIVLFVLLAQGAFAQSVEQGSAFNKFMGAEDGVNPLSGTAAFKRNVATISSGKVSYDVEMSYSSNVEEIVRNKNDIAQTGWIGLGWSLGHAKIISDNAGTMWIGDDSYYLQTASGDRYKIIKDDKDKWWIEGLPYWTLTPEVKNVTFTNRQEKSISYLIIDGWKITNDMGVMYTYGDMDYDVDNSKLKRIATEYTIANPYPNGIVGVYENGQDVLFPSAWNLSKIEDYDGNFLEFSYEQYIEKVRNRVPRVFNFIANTYTTKNGYTKECYLKSVKSSQGDKLEFITKPKDYQREYIDVKGGFEKDENSTPDGYIDPIERRFLSQIVVYGKDGKKLKYIDFCYEPLNVRIGGSYNQDYVKRLLASIVETGASDNGGAAGEEISKEIYAYYKDDLDRKNGISLPLGAIDSIIGPSCGVVKYEYKELPLISVDPSTGLHKDNLPIIKSEMGRLEDGTNYIVGLNVKKGKVELYFRRFGKWEKYPKELVDGDKGVFFIGDQNWFIYRDGKENGNYYAFVWDGKDWVREDIFTDYGSHDVVAVGPGYLLTGHIANGDMRLRIPWAVWRKKGEGDVFNKLITWVDDDDDDRKYIRLITSKNHFAAFYKQKNDYFNSGAMRIYSFTADKKAVETRYYEDLDDDNKYDFLNDNVIIGVTEGEGLNGYYAKALHWWENSNGDGEWYDKVDFELKGWQGTSSIQAMGENYVVVKHNDHDNMTLFDYNGVRWKTYFENENLVHHQDFDPKTEAEWDAVSGYNFFVARKPRIKKHWYGNEIKPFREYELFERMENGEWNRGNSESSGDKKIVYAGSDWYMIKGNQKGFVRNGFDWKFEDYSKNVDGSESYFLKSDAVDRRTLNGDFFIEESKRGDYIYWNGVYDTDIYFKKHDSFKENVKGFFVARKLIKDPVVDKIVKYEYNYSSVVLGKYPIYDYVTKSPVVYSYNITLPDNAGVVEKILCNDGSGVALGSVCEERFYNSSSDLYPVKSIENKFIRYRDDSWPNYIYLDRLTLKTTRNSNISKSERYVYADGVNDLVAKTILHDNNTAKNLSETVNVYAVEKYPALKNSNRVTEKVATYTCVPDCGENIEYADEPYTPKITSAEALTYSDVFDGKLRLYQKWNYTPKKDRATTFSFDWQSSTHGNSWTKVKQVLNYYKGLANEVVDQFGITNSVIFENEKQKMPLASVKNAGLNEVLVLPGEGCSVDNWTDCHFTNLVGGRSLEKNVAGLESSFGRFSKTAILINKHSFLKGTLKEAKGSKYRFSAWVQGTSHKANDDTLVLNVNSSKGSNIGILNFDLKGAGEWEYVEKDVESLLDKEEHSITLSTLNDSEIHLQDVRFVPVDAEVKTTFWDRHISKPVAKADERSVGSYIEYDALGRTVATYGETADGIIAQKSKTTYIPGVCALSSDKTYALKELSVNGKSLAISTVPGTIEIAVKNNVDALNVSWKSYIDGEKVFYRLYKTGEPSDYQEDCCLGSSGITKEFDGNSMTLDIAVSSLAKPYKVKIKKSTVGWIGYGTPLTEGFNPVYLANDNVSGIRYLTEEGIRKASFNGSEWTGFDSEKRSGIFTNLTGAVYNGFDYIFALPENTGIFTSALYRGALVFRDVISGWDNLLSTEVSDLAQSNKYRVATSLNNKIYVLYEKDLLSAKPVPDDKKRINVRHNESLVVKNLNGNAWTDAGVVVNASVLDADIAIGSNNIPYVAYVGKSSDYSITQKIVENPFLNDNEKNESTEMPAGLIEVGSYEEHPVVVVVKHYDDVSKKWVGYSSEKGDVLKLPDGNYLPNARNVKLASDGSNLYMAVLYNDALSSLYALKVYKLIKTNSELQFNELVDQSFASAIIAYIEENNHFDLAVADGVPYVSFANSANDNNITVVKYNSGLWRSVGAPAFANVCKKKNSADLAVVKNQNNKVIPYVVFQEGVGSENINRRNIVVPMMYSSEGDKDLTISKIGDISGTTLASSFRQYILKYDAKVENSVESILFDLTFSTKSDVKGIYVENDGIPVFSWKKERENPFMMFADDYGSNAPKFNVPLKIGPQQITIQIFGSENVPALMYTFSIYRDYVAGFVFGSNNLGAENGNLVFKGKEIVENSSSSSQISLPDNNYNAGNEFNIYSSSDAASNSTIEKYDYQIDPPSDGSTSKKICLEYNSAWSMIIKGLLFTRPECFEYDFEKNEILTPSSSSEYGISPIESSSSGLGSSSSVKGNQIIFIDDNGNKNIIDIVVLTYSSSSYDPMNSSSSSYDPMNSSSSSYDPMNSSSSSYDPMNSSSSSYDPMNSSSSSYDPMNSSSSSYDPMNSSSSSYDPMNSSSSSQINIEGTVIPNEYLLLNNYKFVTETSVSFGNKVSVLNGEFIASNIDVAANALIQGDVLCSGNLILSSNAYIKSIVLGGTLNSQAGATYGSVEQGVVNIPYITRIRFNLGSESLNVWAGQTVTLSPGDYGDVSIYTNATVTFEPGIYHFKSLYIGPDVNVLSQYSNAPIQIWVQDNMRIDDRTSFMADNDPKQVLVYGNAYFDMYVGVHSKISATIVYPNGRVNISPYTEYSGSIWANSINVGANTTIK